MVSKHTLRTAAKRENWIDPKGDLFAPAILNAEPRFSRLLLFAGRLWATRLDNAVKVRTGQSRAKWQALYSIGLGKGAATISEIAQRLSVQWPSIIRVIESLEAEGLVKSDPNPSDGRSRLISLTDKGRASLEGIGPVLQRETAAILDQFEAAEIEAGVEMLSKIIATLEND